MSKYAVIDGNLVVNIIVADDLETAQEATKMTCVEVETCSPGWTYVDGIFAPPQNDEIE
jgi:hypothetical protein